MVETVWLFTQCGPALGTLCLPKEHNLNWETPNRLAGLEVATYWQAVSWVRPEDIA